MYFLKRRLFSISGNGTLFQKMKLSSVKKHSKILLVETGCLSNLYYVLAAQASGFLIYPLFSNIVSYAKPGSLHLTLQPVCDLLDTIYHVFGYQVLPTQHLPMETQSFIMGGKYFKHMLLFT